ncbi:MAG TPA: deoxyribodipyrimidine photo-lyase [Terriglobia bacterium]|nr:deoxyribodipyrimidine photo-lyase [Terriglobia bacterium]
MRNLEELTKNARVTVRKGGLPDPEGSCVVYWMQRAQRALDNPALNVAIEAANILLKPVVAFFGLVPFYPNANLRSYTFLVQGLRDISEGLRQKNVEFVLRRWPDHRLDQFCAQVRPCLVVGDENPMRDPERWRKSAAERLRAPLWTVDADVVVPSMLLGKEQYAARTIRPRIHALLDQFLVSPGNPKARTWQPSKSLESLAVNGDLLAGFPMDTSVQPVLTLQGGTRAALDSLTRFVRDRLNGYATERNHPELDGTSQLSPYLHFGHIGPHTIALTVKNANAPRGDREAFLEQLIVRRELAVNFVKFNPNYDRLQGVGSWALRTLGEHRRDERAQLYTAQQLEDAETHDPLWNAAQRQMVLSGWMQGYLRMYWAKKILEWTRSPEEAYDIAIRLNDRYELDGRDPNGYAGIAWAMGGKHDRAWGPERPVCGKIRYMSYASTSRKFDGKGYIERVKLLESNG